MSTIGTKENGEQATAKALPVRRGVQIMLVSEDSDKLVDFMGKTLGARQYFRAADDKGKVQGISVDINGVALHAVDIGNPVYKGEPKPHARLHLNLNDPKGLAEKLERSSAKTLNKCEKQPWGLTCGTYQDSFGIVWSMSDATGPLEDVPEEKQETIIPHVVLRNASGYVDFLSEVFGAEHSMPALKDPASGKTLNGFLKLNGGQIIISEYMGPDESENLPPQIMISCQVPTGDAEAITKAFVTNGGECVNPPKRMFWAQVWGRAKDPSGQTWVVAEPRGGLPSPDVDMLTETRIGAKYDWKWSWSLEEVPTIYCFGETRTCLAQFEPMRKIMGEIIPRALAEARERGMPLAGPIVSGYYKWDSQKGGETSFTSGPTVTDSAPLADGDSLGLRALAGTKCAVVTHMGSYEELGQAYKATLEWIAAKGLESRMPFVEIYENSADDVKDTELRTKICFPVVPREAPN